MKVLKTHVYWGQGDWDSFFLQKGRRWRDKDYRYVNDIFDLSMMEGSLLDVGCALGDGLAYLRNKCHRINKFVGADYSEKAIEVCQSNQALAGIEFFQHDIMQALPQNYDNIICLATLEHIDDPQVGMQNLVDATENLLLVGVPYRNRRPDKNHVWSFDEDDFSDLTDSFYFDKRHRNIYYLIDKRNMGPSILKERRHFLSDLANKLLRFSAIR
ncbi:MAG: class I SAM-dependent methyltransferase [Phycisphaerales bacterium]|nr:MAG: class I SAM-dependent methyltransferase [Phycisphaerales bacterium]